MARKYARDNRGRFASGGSGATARGGRLKTASGNKRATQTMRAAGAGGVIKGRTARTVAGEKVMAKLAGPRSGQQGRARQRALVNYNKALRKTASLDAGKRSDVAMATSRRALDAYAGKMVKNPRGFTSNGPGTAKSKAQPTVYRTRAQAAAAQRDRTRMTIERSRANYGTPRTQSSGGTGIKLRRVKIDQPNFLTGGTDRVTVAMRAKETGSMAKDSSATRRANRRLARAEARYEQLLSNRETVRKGGKNIISRKQLTRESTVVDAIQSYRNGGGRRKTRKR